MGGHEDVAVDASRLAITFAFLLVGIGLGRFVLTTVGRAGEGLAVLFVPPDRALGWPRGVQESDEPWGWREQPASAAPSRPFDDLDDGPPPDPPERGMWVDPPRGAFTVPVDRVGPIHLGLRSQAAA